MIKLYNKKDCCGCSVCAGICPHECITIQSDEEGFYYPIIDDKACVDCGLCDAHCPVINNKSEIPFVQHGFVVQNLDKGVLMDSTSGGAFTGIAEYVIRKNGVVVGSAFNENNVVEHIIVDRIEDLHKFRNSKYVQSYVDPNIYNKIKSFLRNGRLVCFSGTVCQVEGLRHFIGNHYNENLYCIDIVCRAVPSPFIFKKYIEYQELIHNSKIKNIRFRDKYYGYLFSTLNVSFYNNRKQYHKGIESDPWLRAFFSGICNRPSCYDCVFKKRYRASDITLWDCFDYYNQFKSMKPNLGATNVLVHTEKGLKLFDEVKSSFVVESVDVSRQVSRIKQMTESSPANPKRMPFFEDALKLDGCKLFKRYFPISIPNYIFYWVRVAAIKCRIYPLMKNLLRNGL